MSTTAAARTAAAQMAEQVRYVQRRAEGDALLKFAQMAADLEELIANGASTEAVVERVRYHTEVAGLTTIGTAGETAAYDPTRHSLLAGDAAKGTPVVVVRPGHLHRDTLIAKAIVYSA